MHDPLILHARETIHFINEWNNHYYMKLFNDLANDINA